MLGGVSFLSVGASNRNHIFLCSIKTDTSQFFYGVSINLYLGNSNKSFDEEYGFYHQYGPTIGNFTVTVDGALPSPTDPSFKTAVEGLKPVAAEKFKKVFELYNYARIVGAIEDSSTVTTLTR